MLIVRLGVSSSYYRRAVEIEKRFDFGSKKNWELVKKYCRYSNVLWCVVFDEVINRLWEYRKEGLRIRRIDREMNCQKIVKSGKVFVDFGKYGKKYLEYSDEEKMKEIVRVWMKNDLVRGVRGFGFVCVRSSKGWVWRVFKE